MQPYPTTDNQEKLEQIYKDITEYHYQRRKNHQKIGFYAEPAYSEACLKQGHKEPELGPGEEYYCPYTDDELYLDGTHIEGYHGDINCTDTKYGNVCSNCEEECEYEEGSQNNLWELVQS